MTARLTRSEPLPPLLRQLDPISSTPVVTPDLDAALDQIAHAIVRLPREARRRRFAQPVRVAVVVAAVVLPLSGVAVAAVAVHAHNGPSASGNGIPGRG